MGLIGGGRRKVLRSVDFDSGTIVEYVSIVYLYFIWF